MTFIVSNRREKSVKPAHEKVGKVREERKQTAGFTIQRKGRAELGNTKESETKEGQWEQRKAGDQEAN